MKVMVTGGAGFIGSHIVDRLIEKGYEVVVVDDLSTGKQENLNPAAVFERIDIRKDSLRNVFAKHRPDFVMHLAAKINVRESLKEPIANADTNILGTINLLECCREFKVKKIVYSSSAGCYGDPDKLPCEESHTAKPPNPYAISKYVAELYLHYYFLCHSLDYVILRYSNVYGPRQDPAGEAGVITVFANALINGKAPSIFGKGENTRDFVYVCDVAEANLLAIEKNTESRIFNIGTGREISVNKLFDAVRKMLDSRIEANHTPAIPGEIERSVLDISLAIKELCWQPVQGLDSGLKKTVDWMKKADK